MTDTIIGPGSDFYMKSITELGPATGGEYGHFSSVTLTPRTRGRIPSAQSPLHPPAPLIINDTYCNYYNHFSFYVKHATLIKLDSTSTGMLTIYVMVPHYLDSIIKWPGKGAVDIELPKVLQI